MGRYFPPLNLTLDADERAVKRAYAAVLKETRPDDDPAAFQALVAVRDRALDWVRRRNRESMPAEAAPEEIAAATVASAEPPHAEPTPLAETTPQPLPRSRHPAAEPDAPPAGAHSLALLQRSQQTSLQVLSAMAGALIEEESGNGGPEARPDPSLPERWAALLVAADELDLAGRMALERWITLALDAAMQQHAGTDPVVPRRFAGTVLTLDRAFRWSQDLRRVARLVGEPTGTHPLVFAIERFGEAAVRLAVDPSGFPVIPDSDLVAWFGTYDAPGAKAYRKALSRGRLGLSWSWYAFLSPPAWSVHIGRSAWGIAATIAALIAVYALFDPLADVGAANGFVAFLAVLMAGRVAAGFAAQSLELASLTRVIRRIEAKLAPSLSERQRLVGAARGSRLINVLVGLSFLVLVDGYWLTLVLSAMTIDPDTVAEMIVVPDRKTPGVTFADRLVAQSYLSRARALAVAIDEAIDANPGTPANARRRQALLALRDRFEDRLNRLPIGDYMADFSQFHSEIDRIRRQP